MTSSLRTLYATEKEETEIEETEIEETEIEETEGTEDTDITQRHGGAENAWYCFLLLGSSPLRALAASVRGRSERLSLA
jgi:hypothetical protein